MIVWIEIPAYNPYPADLAEVDSTVACNQPPLRIWLLREYFSWGSEEIVNLVVLGELQIHQLAFYHTLFFETSPANQSFGPNGEYTDQINKSATDIKRFWDTELDNILLVAAHGSILQDRDKVIATFKTPAYGFSDEKANTYADSVATLFNMYPQFLNGNHPAFSFNQNATPDTTFAGVGRIPAKIIVGDGVLQGFETLGFGDIAPQAILAHEYAHHIQYDLGILVRGWQSSEELIPKTSRRIELMCDAYAAYYLAHPRGAAMQGESVQQFLELFFNLGDCEFKDNGHHGTPTQRKAAAEWGYKLATDAQQRGRILPARELARLFDAALSDIIENQSF
jgi:hypothetical protein